jgi:hypothetical protein
VAKARDIFSKQAKITSGQLRAVADHRFDDAKCLLASRQNARANGAMYLGGFVIECLLKALLLDRHPNLQGPVDPATLSEEDREVHRLLFGHALDEMVLFLPEIEKKLIGLTGKNRKAIWPRLVAICEHWTIYARYSPRHANREDAREFLETVSEARKWLKTL